MTTTPTATPVPSTSPVDLLYNVERIDEAVNSSALVYSDRFGSQRRTLQGAIAAIAAVSPRGAWAIGTHYFAKDVVSNAGTWYICMDDHIAGATFSGDATHWRVYQGVVTSDLADTASDFNGAGMVGFKQPGTGAIDRNALAKLRETISAADFGVYESPGVRTTQLQNAINAAAGKRLILRSGTVISVDAALVLDDDIEFDTDGAEPAYIDTLTNSGAAIEIGQNVTPAVTTTLAANVSINRKSIPVANATGIVAGMLILLRSTKAWYHDPREATVISPDSDGTGTAQAGGASTITLKAGTTYTGFAGLALTIESGTGAGQARVVQSYNTGTKVCTMTAAWKTAPDSTSTYRFAQLFKGELHLARRVVGNVIELEAQTWDGYDVVDDTYGDGLEAVTVTAYQPVRAKLRNVHIRRPPTVGANSYGVKASYCVDLELDRVRVDYGQVAGINLEHTYRTRVTGPVVTGANDTSTGYGISISGGSFDVIEGGRLVGNRRGIDFSGTTPCHFPTAAENLVTGGGAQEDGTEYTPEGAVENSGIGSHGSSYGATYRDNIIGSVNDGLVMRGCRETAQGNQFLGDITSTCLYVAHGMNHTIKGNTYRSLFQEGSLGAGLSKVEDDSFEAANIRNRSAPHFIRVLTNYGRGYTNITGNECYGLSRYFLYFDATTVDRYDFNLLDNITYFSPVASSDECALIGVESGSVNLANCTEQNNYINGGDGITSLLRYGVGVNVNNVVGAPANTLGTPQVRTILIADDAAAKVRVGQKGNVLWFGLTAQASLGHAFWGCLSKNSTTLTSFGVNTNVEGRATAPTGTSGTDTKVTVHYDGEFLTIENRAGGARDFHVLLIPME
jgi:hypothetical protein